MTFDPRCAFSIARTVARAAGQENIFMKHLFNNVKEFNLSKVNAAITLFS
jgi:hypothetical protein